MPRHCRHLILLYPLLLGALLGYTQQRESDTLILHFPFNSHRVQPADIAQLNQSLASQRIDSMFIIGYTDKVGSVAYNLQLSRLRAQAAGKLLSGEILDLSRRHIAGEGIAPTTQLSDSENRRVEVILFFTAPPGLAANPTPHHYDTIYATRPANPPHVDSIEVIRREADTSIIALRHINFIVDTPIPTDSTRLILPVYVDQLRQYKEHRLEIDGFVNSIVPLRGAKDPLFILSVRRAKFIYDYLVNAGFDPGKLTYKGMGNASPINPTPVSREEMNANMRVEIKVY
jgi:outer membrane protein OmpA-like peptidoglycan-associated protein